MASRRERRSTAVDRGGDDPLHAGFCTSQGPFLFSIKLPEGNYNVTVTLGDRSGPSTTTIKAELRRLLLEKVETASGQFTTRTFTVNTRTPKISTGGEVKLKDREKTTEFVDWDDKLTLEFNDAHPCLDCAGDRQGRRRRHALHPGRLDGLRPAPRAVE